MHLPRNRRGINTNLKMVLEDRIKEHLADTAIQYYEASEKLVDGERMVKTDEWDDYLTFKAKAQAYSDVLEFINGEYAQLQKRG